VAELEAKIVEMRGGAVPSVIVIDTDPMPSTAAGGTWWEVGVPEVSVRESVRAARVKFEENKQKQSIDG